MRLALLAALALLACAHAPARLPDCRRVPAGTPCDGVATVAPVTFSAGTR